MVFQGGASDRHFAYRLGQSHQADYPAALNAGNMSADFCQNNVALYLQCGGLCVILK